MADEEIELIEVPWDDASEDQFKASWDFHRADGSPVDTLEDLEALTNRDAGDLARDLLRLPFGKAAPRKLIEEALARGR